MRYAFTLAAIPIPVLALGLWTTKPSPTIVAMAVPLEGVRAQRMDADTFRLRWSRVGDLAPMRETLYEPLLLVSHETHRRRPVVAAAASRPASLRTDICARHNMRKVNYGKRWRCRR